MKKFYNCKLKVVKEESGLYVYDNLKIRCPKDIVKMLNSKIDISSEPDEKLWIVCMDIRNNVKCFSELVSGGSNICHIDLKKILDLVKTRIEILPDLEEQVDFFEELPDYDIAMYTHKKMKTNSENSLEVLKEMLPILENHDDYSIDSLHDLIMKYIADKGIKNGQGLWPLRTAVSGKQMTPGGAFEIMEILGKDESIRRIKVGIEKLEQAV